MAELNTPHTPPHAPQSSPPSSVIFNRSTSRRALFEGTASAGNGEHDPTANPQAPILQPPSAACHLPGPSSDSLFTLDLDDTDGASFNNQHAIPASSVPVDFGKYRRIAENAGLRGEQADTAVALAVMTPRTARVQLFTQVTNAVNLLSKFREAQVKNWDIPTKVKTRMHTVVRLALLAPIPSCYKDDLPTLVLRILIQDGNFSKDFETKHDKRAEIVTKEVGSYANRIRSEMKIQIIASITEPYMDILTLTRAICKSLGKDNVNITRELVGAVAYLRGITALQAEGRTAVALIADRDVWWDLLERRVNETRARHQTSDARMKHLQEWLKDDQESYGRADADKLAALRADSTVLQAAVFEAQFKGGEQLRKEIARKA